MGNARGRYFQRARFQVSATPRVLVIEDDPGVREGIATVIESEGYLVISCEDAKEALDRSQRAWVVPQRFFTHGQRSTGDRHVYAQRTRFIPGPILEHF